MGRPGLDIEHHLAEEGSVGFKIGSRSETFPNGRKSPVAIVPDKAVGSIGSAPERKSALLRALPLDG